MAWSRAALAQSFTLLLVLGTALSFAQPVQGQAATAPPFVEGANTLYCHASEDDLTVWMNSLKDDGAGTPYYLTGDSTVTDPVLGVGYDPVAHEAVEAHIPLTPMLTGAVVLKGTVTAQAFIGSGGFGGGEGTFGVSLMVGTTTIGSAAPVQTIMKPHNGNVPGGATETYEEITWTFDIPDTTVPAGAPLEWVISGTIDAGNNIFLACSLPRGQSNIVVPVLALEAADAGASASTNSTTGASSSSTSGSASASSSSHSGSSSASSSSRSSSTSRSASQTVSASASNSTTNATAATSKGSPAPQLLPVLGVLGLVAVMARRRLRR